MKLTLLAAMALLPPLEYDFEPTQAYKVWRVDRPTVELICGPPTQYYIIWACAAPRINEIYIVDDLEPVVEAMVLRHEKAHLNGWVH